MAGRKFYLAGNDGGSGGFGPFSGKPFFLRANGREKKVPLRIRLPTLFHACPFLISLILFAMQIQIYCKFFSFRPEGRGNCAFITTRSLWIGLVALFQTTSTSGLGVSLEKGGASSYLPEKYFNLSTSTSTPGLAGQCRCTPQWGWGREGWWLLATREGGRLRGVQHPNPRRHWYWHKNRGLLPITRATV